MAQGAQYGSPAGSAGRDHTSATSVAKYKREDGIKQGRKNKQNENREEKFYEKAKGDKLADSQSFLSPANYSDARPNWEPSTGPLGTKIIGAKLNLSSPSYDLALPVVPEGSAPVHRNRFGEDPGQGVCRLTRHPGVGKSTEGKEVWLPRHTLCSQGLR